MHQNKFILHCKEAPAIITIPDFLSTTCRAARYCVAAIGFVLALAFISYSVFLKQTGEVHGAAEDLILGFGIFVATQSCFIACLNSAGDRQVRQLVTDMNTQMDRLRFANETLGARVDQLSGVQRQLEALVARQRRHGEELNATAAEMRRIKDAYAEQLAVVSAAHDAVQEELAAVQHMAGLGQERVRELEALAAQQRAHITEIETQLVNLNALQRKSTEMIRLLATYGDDCKTLGVSLQSTANDLRETDNSLGLTAVEMAAQLTALQAVTDQLRNVASFRTADAPP